MSCNSWLCSCQLSFFRLVRCRRLWPYCIGGALDECFDLLDLFVRQLACEIGHALDGQGPVEHELVELRDDLRWRISQVRNGAAFIDAGHAVTEGTIADVQRRTLRDIFGFVLHTREQVAELVFDELRQFRLPAQREGIY